MADALRADAGDDDGCADVEGSRAAVAEGRTGGPAEAAALCVRTTPRARGVPVLTGQIGEGASAFKKGHPRPRAWRPLM